MSYDASAQTLRCPFCGSEKLEEKSDAKVLAPRRVVPFVIEREQAEQSLRSWLGRGFWRPGDLSESAAITKMTPVYVPYWVFSARTFTYWTADSSQTPFGARGDWVPMTGEHRGNYSGVMIGASGVLTAAETSALGAYDLGRAVPPGDVDLVNMVVEQFRVHRKYARPLARAALENMERQSCTAYVPARCRNLHVNVRIEGQHSEPVLFPVWIMAYRYKGRVFRFLLNGQTGRATGQAPFSWKKLVILCGILGGILLLVLLAMALAGV
jgi:hypothetical protein